MYSDLMKSCEDNDLEEVRSCLARGDDVNYQNPKYGFTAAHLASIDGHTEIIRLLAGTGKVDWNLQNKWGYTPLHRALLWGYPDIVEIISKIPGVDFSVKAEDGVTLAQASIIGGEVESVKSLANLEEFHGWNVPDVDGDTPVMMALKCGDTDMVKVLVMCPRVDLTIRDKEGWTLVMRTMKKKKLGEC